MIRQGRYTKKVKDESLGSVNYEDHQLLHLELDVFADAIEFLGRGLAQHRDGTRHLVARELDVDCLVARGGFCTHLHGGARAHEDLLRSRSWMNGWTARCVNGINWLLPVLYKCVE